MGLLEVHSAVLLVAPVQYYCKISEMTVRVPAGLMYPMCNGPSMFSAQNVFGLLCGCSSFRI